MTRKLTETLLLSLFLFAFLAGSVFGLTNDRKLSQKMANLKYTMLKNQIMGADEYSMKVLGEEGNVDDFEGTHFAVNGANRGGAIVPQAQPGLAMGYTTYDYQHNSRMARMVAWRGDHRIHFDWMKKNNNVEGAGTYRMTAYQLWQTDVLPAAFKWSTTSLLGGRDVHVPTERSGYAGIDVLPAGASGLGRAIVYNHFDLTGGAGGELNYLPTIWPDFSPGLGNFATYKQSPPAALLAGSSTGEFIWPYVSAQITTGEDTVIHIVARESDDNREFSPIRYFRRVGPVDPADPSVAWTGFTIDTIATISYVVEIAPSTAPNPDKAAIVWAAHWPAVPGDPVSTTPGALSLLVEQMQNDVYCMISDDAGETWDDVHNISQTDSTVGGFVILGDMSGLIDTDGRLHVVWAAAPTGPLSPGTTGSSALDWEWPRFPFSSRILHWSDEYINDANSTDYITVVKDGTWDWQTTDDESDDTICIGGAWHSMALNNPSLTQCDDKLYTVFAQFQDLDNGVWDNCHNRAFTQLATSASANGLLFFSVSTMNNGGLNWDPARPLTATTPRCDTTGSILCHSHFWHSTARYGMETGGLDDFSDAVVVQDPSWTYTSTDYYLDVTYVDDLNPGGVIQGEGGWTVNPFKWFRVPCVEPVAQPILAIDPLGVFTPAWNKPGVAVPYNVTLFNIGNSPLTINSIVATETEGPTTGWLGIGSFPTSITEQVPNNFGNVTVTVNNGGVINAGLAPAVLKGHATITWEGSKTTVFPVDFIVADTIQIPQMDTLLTNSISLVINNAGGLGLSHIGDTLGQMDFNGNIECDDCFRAPHNDAGKYLAEASPFLMLDDGTDTLVSAYVQNHSWLSEHPVSKLKDGFRPQNTVSPKSIVGTHPYKQITYSGIFYNADSTVALENMVYAPKGQADGGNFFGQGLKVYNISGAPINDLWIGQFEDWDIPSDSLVNNGSNFSSSRKLMFQWGWETAAADTYCEGQNDCADANKRYGGSAFIGQFKVDPDISGTLSRYAFNANQQCAFTWKLSTYMAGGHLRYDSLFQQKLDGGCGGYTAFEDPSESPDSVFMDLFNIAIYGQYDLGVNDTLYFFKALVNKYQDNGSDGTPISFFTNVDSAVASLKRTAGFCCRVLGYPGDVTGATGLPGVPNATGSLSSSVNVLDIVYIVNFKFKSGPNVQWPSASYPCESLMDADGNGAVNVLDIVALVNYKFKNGTAPVCPW